MSINPQEELPTTTTKAQIYPNHSELHKECGSCNGSEAPIRSDECAPSESQKQSETLNGRHSEVPKCSETSTNQTQSTGNHLDATAAATTVRSSQIGPTSNTSENSHRVNSSLLGVGITMLSAMRQSVAPKLFNKADNSEKKLCGNSADVTTTTSSSEPSNSQSHLTKPESKHDSQSNGHLSSSLEPTVNSQPAAESANSRLQETVENGKKCSACICHRPVSYVVCLECRNYFHGHALRVCPEHPRRINLMDIAVCPNVKCRGTQLEERSSTPSPVTVPEEEKSSEECVAQEEETGDKIKSD